MPPEKIKVACIQMNVGSDRAANITQASDFIAQAARAGARFVLTPENMCGLYADPQARLAAAASEQDHPALPVFSDLARDHGIYLLAGSLAIRAAAAGEKIYNRSYLFGPTGARLAAYDKIHLFDVDLPNGDRYRESESCHAGDRAVVAQTEIGNIGLTICYDVRFPHLYRALAQAGTQIMTVPAAFTVPTGQAHWATLLRARAIECGAFVLAPAQTGTHAPGRHTYGHSMIIGPWGDVLAEAGDQLGVIFADIDLKEVAKARSSIPSLQHDRPFRTERVHG